MIKISAILGAGILSIMSAPAYAIDACDDLWFTRNLIFDRAGYCFGSPLGQAIFDNADCQTSAPDLSDADKRFVMDIRELENEWQCSLSPNRQTINVDDIDLRKAMQDLPVTDGLESACVGWRGEAHTLYAARDTQSPITGTLKSGQTILWLFAGHQDWAFVVISFEGVTQAMGWNQSIDMSEGPCDFAAG